MEELLPQISPWVLIALGVAFIGLEMLFTSFVLLFFGQGFIIVGIISFFIVMPGEMQILFSLVIGGALTYILRTLFIKSMRAEDLTLETLETGDVGIIVESNGKTRVEYKGTTWAYHIEDDFQPKAGERVIVVELKNNMARVASLEAKS